MTPNGHEISHEQEDICNFPLTTMACILYEELKIEAWWHVSRVFLLSLENKGIMACLRGLPIALRKYRCKYNSGMSEVSSYCLEKTEAYICSKVSSYCLEAIQACGMSGVSSQCLTSDNSCVLFTNSLYLP